MYLRYTTRKKDGKVHRYWRLVRSVRVGRRVIQQTVAHLGELDEHGRLEARAFARRLIGAPEQAQLFSDGGEQVTAPVRLNPLAQRGYSRDHRADCKQVCIALVVTFDGFPLGYEVFPGNTSDVRTLKTIVTTMEARHGAIGRVWIADRGLSSRENLSWLRETQRRYIIGAAKSELKKFSTALAAARGWRKLREDVEVKLTRCPETHDTIILCRSAQRRAKERAMHEKFRDRKSVV